MRISAFGICVNEPTPFVDERLKMMSNALRSTEADIIVLQEIYEDAHKRRLADELADQYPHHTWASDGGWVRFSNGLMLLSRFPIDEMRFTRYFDAPLDEHVLTSKGFLRSRVHTPFGHIRLFNTHTVAGGIGHPEHVRCEQARTKQFAQLCDAIREDEDSLTLAVGDFNAGPEASPHNYEMLLAYGLIDAYTAADHRSGPLVTWDPQNPLNINGPHKMCPAQRIDHVMLTPGASKKLRVETADVLLHQATVPVRTRAVTPSDHYAFRVRLAGR